MSKSQRQTNKTKHPSKQQLSDFLNGLLSSKNQKVVEAHVDQCQSCCEKLEQVNEDTLGDRLRSAGTQFDSMLVEEDYNTTIPSVLIDHPRYELIEKIGSGGMGDVYRARQRTMDREVAIKILRRHLFENERAIARFQNEIKAAARLNHPSIVHSYDAETSEGANLLVMELVEGQQLSDFVKSSTRLPPKVACSIAIQIATGLQYAHSQGMIHRDIKPQNVLVQKNGDIKITDFGLAKFVQHSADADRSLTLEGETFGTPDFIAPEQIRDAAGADIRSDIYSLGCSLYFMLTGRPPFEETSIGEKLAGHLGRSPDSILQLQSEVPNVTVAAVEKMMQKNPEDRFQNYDEVIVSLSALDCENEGDATIQSIRLDPSVQKTSDAEAVSVLAGKSVSRNRRSWIVAATIGLGITGLGILSLPYWSDRGVIPPAKKDDTIRIAVVIPFQNAYHPEANSLLEAFSKHANIQFEFISEQKGRVKFTHRNRQRPQPSSMQIKRTLSECSVSEFDAIVFTGAWNGVDAFNTAYGFDPELNQQAKLFSGSMLSENKPVTAVCGGTIVLAKAGILEGKNVANCRYIEDSIKRKSKANWSAPISKDKDAIVVQDGLLITGGNSINCSELVERILRSVADRR